MADTKRKGRKDSRKYCLPYVENSVCNKDKCKYIHKKGQFLEVDTVNVKEGFVCGRIIPHDPMCRFFLRGECTQGASCRFRHEDDTTTSSDNTMSTDDTTTQLNNNLNNDYNSTTNIAAANNNVSLLAPSTSTNDYVAIDAELISDLVVEKENSINNINAAGMLQSQPAAAEESGSGACDGDIAQGSEPKIDDADNNAAQTTRPILGAAWANAPEFVPKQKAFIKSYAFACNPTIASRTESISDSEKKLCSFVAKTGHCKFPPGECIYLHGDICDLCGNAVLHPYNEEQKRIHYAECVKQHEKNMEHSFAIARSKDKTCGICFEVIMEKACGEQRFGILPNCNHCFCLACIRRWRQAHQFENKIIRACPECRVTSDFVCPSSYWVDTKEDKDKLIDDYKKALSTKDCKYFKRGSGTCPFGNKCFYRHAFPDGRVCDVGPPPRQRRVQTNIDGEELGVYQHVILWDFIDERDSDPSWQAFVEDLEELGDFFTDSEDSDWSDYEYFFEH